MQKLFFKAVENDDLRVIAFTLVFVIGLKLYAPIFSEYAKYVWIAVAGLISAMFLKVEDKPQWSTALFVVIAMSPMGYIERDIGLIGIVVVMSVSIFFVRAMQRRGHLSGLGCAVVLGFGFAFFVNRLTESIPQDLGNFRFGF